LQELNADRVPLVGVDVSGAFLQGIRLRGARLLRSNFSAVDARGGLITLNSSVNPGQTLLLINTMNQKEQKCSVVRQNSTQIRAAIVVEFPQPVPDYWDTAHY